MPSERQRFVKQTRTAQELGRTQFGDRSFEALDKGLARFDGHVSRRLRFCSLKQRDDDRLRLAYRPEGLLGLRSVLIMVFAPEFLVIDDNRDSRFLLAKTLLRKFPDAILHECETSGDALNAVRSRPLAAIISHRTADTPGIELLLELRAVNPSVPIVMVSGADRKEAALAAGADRFILYDECLRIWDGCG